MVTMVLSLLLTSLTLAAIAVAVYLPAEMFRSRVGWLLAKYLVTATGLFFSAGVVLGVTLLLIDLWKAVLS